MRPTTKLAERLPAANDRDPRDEHGGAQIIDLATRNVLPQVAAKKPRSDAFGLAAGVVFVGLLGAVTLWSMDTARTAQTPNKKNLPTQIGTPVPAAPAVPPQAITPAPGTAPAAPPQQAVLAAPPQTGAQPGTFANPHSSPTIVFDASAQPAPAPGLVAPGVPAPGATAPGGTGNDEFAARLGGVGGSTATATSKFDPRTTVTQGTLIPAVLETAIDTDVPGFVRAIVSADVRSFDGARVLVPRSSRLIGQYKSGMSSGQKRAYVIWTRLIRPDGVSVNIASPAIGFSGETGLAGKVNSHFFERFGSSMLLSVIGGIPSLIGNSANVIIGGGGQSAAAAAIGQSGQISPTVRVRQGEPIRVFTARDLDFSQVSGG